MKDGLSKLVRFLLAWGIDPFGKGVAVAGGMVVTIGPSNGLLRWSADIVASEIDLAAMVFVEECKVWMAAGYSVFSRLAG